MGSAAVPWVDSVTEQGHPDWGDAPKGLPEPIVERIGALDENGGGGERHLGARPHQAAAALHEHGRRCVWVERRRRLFDVARIRQADAEGLARRIERHVRPLPEVIALELGRNRRVGQRSKKEVADRCHGQQQHGYDADHDSFHRR